MFDLQDEIHQFDNLDRELSKDFFTCLDAIEVKDSQYLRRQLCRSAFAFIEASTYRMKQIVYKSHLEGFCTLKISEIALIVEKSQEIDDRGRIKERQAALPTLNNIRFTLNLIQKHFAPSYLPPVSHRGWEATRKALKIRHRLMHPKSVKDMDISDEELELIRLAVSWNRTTIGEAFHLIADYLRQISKNKVKPDQKPD